MPISRPSSRRPRGHLLAASAAVLLIGCADLATPPLAPDESPAFGKPAASGITVSSTLPKSGEKGRTIDVHVYGSGFAAGATATWALHGVADPSKVKTNKTTVVSSTELIANITIAPDATIDYWDVQVSAAFCCKTGVGTEMFEVTSAMPVGGGQALGVNDAGDIVGLNNGAFVVSGADGSYSDLGPRKTTGISQDGLVAVGGVNGSDKFASYAGVWTRAAGAPWPAGAHLPELPGITETSGLAYAVAAIPVEGVTVITGVLTLPATPVYWQSNDGTWTSPARALPMPAGYAGTPNSALGISATGDIVGQLNDPSGKSMAVVWRRASGGYPAADVLPLPSGYLSGRLRAISPDGTIVAGMVQNSSKGKNLLAPAFWMRDANGVYTVRLLPSLTGSYDAVGAVNALGVYGVTVVGSQVRAVGTSASLTNQSFIHGVLWTWTAGSTDFQVRDIGGLGTKTDVTPSAINPAGTMAAGSDGTGSIKWLLQ